MVDPKCRATARVTLTVEIPADSWWGHDTKIDQILHQAGTETKAKLANILRDSKVRGVIIGEPKVVAVLVEDHD